MRSAQPPEAIGHQGALPRWGRARWGRPRGAGLGIGLRTAGLVLAAAATGCGGTAGTGPDGVPTTPRPPGTGTGTGQSSGTGPGPGRGFPVAGPWASFYGPATGIDLDRTAAEYRIINIDADPDTGNFTADQITRLRAGGRNRVISYFNLGAVEKSRAYWSRAPGGLVPAGANRAARLGAYDGYPDEVWMNPADPDWQRLVLEHIAPRLVRQGVDGFYFDNLEVVEHQADGPQGRCDRRCAQGGLDLVAKLRARYPRLLFVMQNATGDPTLRGTAGGGPFPALLDGVAHEDTFTTPADADDTADAEEAVYRVETDQDAVDELARWRNVGHRPGGRPFWVATEDYVNTCGNTADAQTVFARARAQGFSAYVSDTSAGQSTVCHWDGLRPR